MPRHTTRSAIRMHGVALDIYLDIYTHTTEYINTADPGPGAAQCVVELRGPGSIAPTCSPAAGPGGSQEKVFRQKCNERKTFK